MATYQVSRNYTLDELIELEQEGYRVESPAGTPSTIAGIVSWGKDQPDNINVRFSTYNIYPRITKIVVSIQQVQPGAEQVAPGPILDKF